MQAIKNLIITSVIAFLFIGSPVTQAQDQPLTQTLEALVTALDKWQNAQAQAGAETKKAQERKLKLLENEVEEYRLELARSEEDEQEAREKMTEDGYIKCEVYDNARREHEQEAREKMTDVEFVNCKTWLRAGEERFAYGSALYLSKNEKKLHTGIMLNYAMEVEEKLDSLTEKLVNVLTQLAPMLNQNEQ